MLLLLLVVLVCVVDDVGWRVKEKMLANEHVCFLVNSGESGWSVRPSCSLQWFVQERAAEYFF